ncbi:hypothetical protein ACA910_014339 [Epithemia clementina (nom. ined.)]
MKTSSLFVVLVTGTSVLLFSSLQLRALWQVSFTSFSAPDHSNVPDRPTDTTTIGSSSSSSFPIVDILSIGSRHLPDLQQAQRDTFGSHPAVRYFYSATEFDDFEAHCDRSLSYMSAMQIALLCRYRHNKAAYPVLDKLAQGFIRKRKLIEKANPSGWVCAQKRPIAAFWNMMQKYYVSQPQQQNDDKTTIMTNNNHTVFANSAADYHAAATNATNLPDYLIVLDDDAFVNLDLILPHITGQPQQQQHQPRVVAGCLVVVEHQLDFTMPHGGFGLVWNRRALERFLQPIYCNHSSDANSSNHSSYRPSLAITNNQEFEQMACWRMQQNNIGELPLFRPGMSIATLFRAYAKNQPFKRYRRWNDVGYCLHSDTAWGYFVNYYPLANLADERQSHFLPTSQSNHVTRGNASSLSDRLVGYNQSQIRFWGNPPSDPNLLRECRHGTDLPPFPETGDENCPVDAHFCHRITASHMYHLHHQQQNPKRIPY